VGFGALEGIITTHPDMAGRLSPLCGMANGDRFRRLPPLAGLRFGDEALFKTGRAGMFGSDDTGPHRSLRWAIDQDQPLGSDSGVAPTARTDAGTVPRAAGLSPPGPQTPRLASRVEELGAQVLVRGAIAVPSRCTCIDHCPGAY
jgi:hypothetical protein